MKRFLMLFVVCCLVFNTAFSGVFAADATAVEFSVSEIKSIISEFEEKLGNVGAVDRNEAFLLGKTYLSTDDGIDTLIEIISNDEMATNPVVADIYDVLGDVSERKEQLIFLLDFLKCLDEKDRESALETFRQRESISFSSSEKGDINDIFIYFTDENIGETLQGENSVTGEMIASLFAVFDDRIMLTDTSVGSADFELKSISSSYENKLDNMLEAYTVSGKSYGGEDFIEMIIEDVNNEIPKATKLKIKNVFEAVGIYEAKEKKKTSSSTNNEKTYTSDSSEKGGSGSSSNIAYGTSSPGYIVSPTEIVSQNKAAGNELENFDDTQYHWASDYIAVLRHKKVLAGDGGTNNFRPDSRITREEMAVLVMRVLNIRDNALETNHNGLNFNDSESVSDWAYNSVAFLTLNGILRGYPDGSFGPQREITREEAIAIISRVLEYKYSPNAKFTLYADWDDVGDWAKDDVVYGTRLGIINGYTTGEFLPKNNIARAEVAAIIYRMMCVEGLIK